MAGIPFLAFLDHTPYHDTIHHTIVSLYPYDYNPLPFTFTIHWYPSQGPPAVTVSQVVRLLLNYNPS